MRYLPPFDLVRSMVEVLTVRNDGYFENRLPFTMLVDEQWYLDCNPDVAEGVRKGIIASGQQHFLDDGYREGRLPHEL